jgi:PAS domain S-box-containing protein
MQARSEKSHGEHAGPVQGTEHAWLRSEIGLAVLVAFIIVAVWLLAIQRIWSGAWTPAAWLVLGAGVSAGLLAGLCLYGWLSADRVRQENHALFRQCQGLEAFFTTIEQTGHHALVTVDPEGRVLRTNYAFQELTGLTPENIKGRLFNSLEAATTEGACLIITDNRIQIAHMRPCALSDPQGKPVKVLANIQPVDAPGGRHLGAVISLINPEPHERSLKRYRQREKVLSQMILQAGHGFWLLNRRLELLEVNRSLCEILRRPWRDLIGHDALELVFPDQREVFKRFFQYVDQDRDKLTTTLLRSDGSALPVEIAASVLQDGSRSGYTVFAFITDLSEQHRLKEELAKYMQ